MLRDVRTTKAVNNYKIVYIDDTDYILDVTEKKQFKMIVINFDKLE